MAREWAKGDVAAAYCDRCHRTVRAYFQLRTIQLRRTRLDVPDVLVAVCADCDHTVALPKQSIPQLREAGLAK